RLDRDSAVESSEIGSGRRTGPAQLSLQAPAATFDALGKLEPGEVTADVADLGLHVQTGGRRRAPCLPGSSQADAPLRAAQISLLDAPKGPLRHGLQHQAAKLPLAHAELVGDNVQ